MASANTQVTAHTAKVSMIESAGMSVKDGRGQASGGDRCGRKGQILRGELGNATEMLVEPVGEAAKNLQDPSK